MHAALAVQPQEPGRGHTSLLAQCASPGADDRPPAYARLEELLGGDLARLLVVALAGPYGRCGSSSP